MKFSIRKFKDLPGYSRISEPITASIYFASLFLAQVLKGTIVAEFDYFLYLFFIFQFFGSTFQGSLSDIYKRSTVLNFSFCLIITLVTSLIFLHGKEGSIFHILQGACLICIAVGGNVDVVGRAGAIDIYFDVDRRKLMSWTVFFEAFAWVILGLLMRFLNLNFFALMLCSAILATILLLLSSIFNIDITEDKEELRNPAHEARMVVKSNAKLLLYFSLTLLSAQFGYFFFFYSQENPIPKTGMGQILLADTYLAWFIGMSLGCLLLIGLKKCSDFKLIIFGVLLSLASLLLFLLDGSKNVMESNSLTYDLLIYCAAGFGSGVFLPCFYSLISSGHTPHVQGFLTGYVDSLRVLGDMSINIVLPWVLWQHGLATLASALFYALSIILLIYFKKTLFQSTKNL